MKIYVVSAQYCEETIILGATLDERTAKRIVECEEQQKIKPDWVDYEEYNTDDYIPLNVGMNPYKVCFYHDSSYEVEIASLCAFVQNDTYETMNNGKKCLRCNVYALGKQNALRQATILKEKYEEQQKEL